MSINVVLFDLGGVLVELGGMGDLRFLASDARDDELWRRWLECPWVRRFERGECDAETFARGIVEAWSMPITPSAFLETFAAWPRGWLPGARELVESMLSDLRIGCLSNTNALHAERHWTRLGIPELFEERFLSHEMGVVKPDREIFDRVVETLGCPAEAVLFLDDNQINVEGARAAGLHAERVRGPSEARRALVDRGLLPRS
ncbi:MAG TPA: HAD family phosphatase [Deltaproteobacteria bacterium]|nr:HAD family phosphatase [Deltaproteobacteria bacterium]